MTVHLPSHDVHAGGSVSVQEAASALGCSEKTIRRRIKAGTLIAHQLPTSQGYEWRVHLDGANDQPTPSPAVQVNGQHDQLPGDAAQVDVQTSERAGSLSPRPNEGSNEPLLKALGLVERLQRENMELAGRVGFLQAKLQTAEEQLLSLASGPPARIDADPEPVAASAPSAIPWLERLLTRLRGG
jgi:excisionase family DNA binding protein